MKFVYSWNSLTPFRLCSAFVLLEFPKIEFGKAFLKARRFSSVLALV